MIVEFLDMLSSFCNYIHGSLPGLVNISEKGGEREVIASRR